MAEFELVDLVRQALLTTLILSAPVLAAVALVGLLVGAFQTVTQVHDPVLSFAPKLIAALVVFSVILPWWMQQLSEYAAHVLSWMPH